MKTTVFKNELKKLLFLKTIIFITKRQFFKNKKTLASLTIITLFNTREIITNETLKEFIKQNILYVKNTLNYKIKEISNIRYFTGLKTFQYLQYFEKIWSLLIVKFSCRQCSMYVKILPKSNVEMTLFISKNVFFTVHTIFFLLKKHLILMTLTITLEFRII